VRALFYALPKVIPATSFPFLGRFGGFFLKSEGFPFFAGFFFPSSYRDPGIFITLSGLTFICALSGVCLGRFFFAYFGVVLLLFSSYS